MKYGFIKVASAIPAVKVADCKFNAQQIDTQIAIADGKGVQVIVFPELCITGYSCADLFGQTLLLEGAEIALMQIMNNTRQMDIISIVGMPVVVNSTLMNCAVALQKGKILGVVPKTYLPNHKESSEQRWFASASTTNETQIRLCGQCVPFGKNLLFDTAETCFGIELGDDLWAPIPASSTLALKGAEIIFNLSADVESIGKYTYLCSLVNQQSARCLSGYVLSSCGFGESTTDVVFGGNGLIAENGVMLATAERFSLKEQLIISEIDVERLRNERRTNTTFLANQALVKDEPATHVSTELVNQRELILTRTIDALPFVPKGDIMNQRCEEIFEIQVMGLAKRLVHTNCKAAVVGISGGLDSTLALLVCAKTFDKLGLSRKGIIGITMPGFGTTDRTYNNALELMASLGVETREISIKEACITHLRDIGHDINNHDITYENAQARERTQILMDIANKEGGILVGTGDLSEIALGWCTYNADHMSMYGVNAGIPKTLVRHLVDYVAGKSGGKTDEILYDILDTPVSPELLPPDEAGNIAQKTEDKIGPYELHDFFLYHFVRLGEDKEKIAFLAEKAFGGSYSEETVDKWLTTFIRRFFISQFKRSCSPDGPKVGTVGLSPRGDWQMPSDADFSQWLK